METGRDAPRRGGSRALASAVGSCLAGAALVLFALSRVWSEQVTVRPGLSDLRVSHTGAAELPWLPAVAFVALAGAGALLATNGGTRRAVGVLLLLAGAAPVVGVLGGRADLDFQAAGAAVWPVATVLGGVLVMLGGWRTVRSGHRWPTMGARYERAAPPAGRSAATAQHDATGPDDAASRDDAAGLDDAGRQRGQAAVDTRLAWEALDRGEDPTDS
ncbi:MAG TPA: Trp biosynthesis-associated membrane protein [Actinoplanes sp.]|nr:Trp biosynthesis-associated membrane protein [Actinoplanes sp.]